MLALLREAIKTERVVALRYFGQSSKEVSWKRVQPYGMLPRSIGVTRCVGRR